MKALDKEAMTTNNKFNITFQFKVLLKNNNRSMLTV